MEKFLFKTINNLSHKKLILEAFHDTDLNNRNGYDVDFLGIKVGLPGVSDEELTKSIAQNTRPGANGKNFLDYANFSVMFNKDKKLPFFTAVNIVGKSNEIAGVHESRGSDYWFDDDRIQENGNGFQFTKADYSGSKFQKGHMVRFYDPAWGDSEEKKKIAMGDTFHYTNCCPQVGKYNAGVWNDLEDYYMARAIFQDDKVTVFTGPIFNKAKQVKKLLVPINFWKIIVYKIKNKLEAMAFLISHEIAFEKMVAERLLIEEKKEVSPTLKQSDIDRLFNEKNLKKWVVKVELIEEKTGINFNLSHVDLNKDKPMYFNIRTSELDQEIKKMKFVMEHESVKTDLKTDDDTEFIKNI